MGCNYTGGLKMRDIHNTDVLTFFETNKNNKHIKNALSELDNTVNKPRTVEYNGKSISLPVYDDYLTYLDENSGDDASFTLTELNKIKRGEISIKHTTDGTFQLIPMLKLVQVKYVGKKDKKEEFIIPVKDWNAFRRKYGRDTIDKIYEITNRLVMSYNDFYKKSNNTNMITVVN